MIVTAVAFSRQMWYNLLVRIALVSLVIIFVEVYYMEFYEAINSRKTIREFEDEIIPEDVIERIISAAFKAPTNDHMKQQ